MRKPSNIWWIFTAASLTLFLGLAWLSVAALRLEEKKMLAHLESEVSKRARLAMWRLDSEMGPLIAKEGARLPFTSPSEPEYSEEILARFEIDERGIWNWTYQRQASSSDIAQPNESNRLAISPDASRRGEDSLRETLSFDALFAASPDLWITSPTASQYVTNPLSNALPRAQRFQSNNEQSADWEGRASNIAKFTKQAIEFNSDSDESLLDSSSIRVGLMEPLWMSDALILARRVDRNGLLSVQCVWLDWMLVERLLKSKIADLLPNARLEAVPADAHVQPQSQWTMVSLPVQLVPGELPAEALPADSPIWLTLAWTWGAAILTTVAIASLLTGTLRLSERRATFASAVTHELRTPLTTFQMYTEMLVQGMVSGEDKRQSYLKVLYTESQRLGRLVENVLAYSRLEKKRSTQNRISIRLQDLLDRIIPSLQARAKQSKLEWVIVNHTTENTCFYLDVSVVEQILFNLVDNACKYASDSQPPHIELHVRLNQRHLIFSIRDYGPGIEKKDRRRIFEPFQKGFKDQSGTAGGIGLGLALAHRMARDMNGDLTLHPLPSPGACFVLSLPRTK